MVADQGRRPCKRFIAIVIDGCRADRLLEADTPFIDRMRQQSVDYVNTSTVYPAHTVTGFSSMFTGAPPKSHGMRSNFVPSPGVKCESIFDSLRDSGFSGRLVGIAHLVDAFGGDVETVTAVPHNDEIDDALVARDKSWPSKTALRRTSRWLFIIPAYNEAENLPSMLSRIPRGKLHNIFVIAVDDGSSDESAEIASLHGADIVVSHQWNRGLGAALRSGLQAAREKDARAAVYLDADGEYLPEQIPGLLAAIESGEADYVLGSRYLGTRDRQPFSRMVANRIFTCLLCLASGRRITDGQTGFRAFSGRALECAEIIHDYNYAQVLTLDLLKKGMRIREVPISNRFRTKGKSFISVKYLWRVPAAMLREMLS